jgi:glycosyltransferase involved in cell wall biosynthesis
MKIVQVVTQLEQGGAQQVARILDRGFAQAGHESRLVFLYTKRDAFSGPSITSLYLKYPGKIAYVVIAVRLWRYLWKERPDVVIAHTHFSNILALGLAFLCGIPGRVAVHHSPLHAYPVLAKIMTWLLGHSCVFTRQVLVSNAVLASVNDHYQSAFKRKCVVIENGIRQVEGDQKYPVPARVDDQIVLGHVGRFSHEKNQKLLVDLLAFNPRYYLRLVGDGPLKSELSTYAEKQGVSNRIIFCGEVNHDEIPRHLTQMDFFVFPSTYESMGLAMVEAMQYGIPVVGSDIPALRDVLTAEDGSLSGLLVSSPWPIDFHLAITHLLNHPRLLAENVEKAKIKARRYSDTSMIRSYLNLVAT